MAASALRLLLVVWLLTCLCDGLGIPMPAGAGTQPEPASAPPQPAAQPEGNASTGKQLFDGNLRFQAGGPPCAACHDAAGLPFPRGGTLGPNLAGTYSKFGTQALANVLSTLFFPTMAPIFDQRPLTAGEQRDLEAFFKDAAGRPGQPDLTGRLLALGILGAVVFLLAAWVWQKRSCPPPVHRSLLLRRSGGVR